MARVTDHDETADKLPGKVQLVSNDNEIREGKAVILQPSTVFYNPVQELNRDLTIAFLSCWSKIQCEKNSKGLRILEGLSASGLRSIRFGLELNNIETIVANDYDKRAVEYIDKNILLNNLENKVVASHGDASEVMRQSVSSKILFDVIDLDPYGSPAPFFDAAVQAIADDGILCITCTDTAILCGNAPETCYAKYGAVSIHSKHCHEMALRIVLQSISQHASQHGRYIEPLLSMSIDFYIRLFVRVKTGQGMVKRSAMQKGMLMYCVGCGASHVQPLMTESSSNGRNLKFSPATTPAVSDKCQNCNSRHCLAGPVWTDKIHDQMFVRELVEWMSGNGDKFSTSTRIIGKLNLICEELVDIPLYYVLDNLCNIVHVNAPRMMALRSAILHCGYCVSFSHAVKNSIKTDAPMEVIWDIMRCWEKENPVSEKWMKEGTVPYAILSQTPKIKADFSLHELCNPASRKEGMVRFPSNPQKNWGPQAKAGGGLSLEERRAKGLSRAQKKREKRKLGQKEQDHSAKSVKKENLKDDTGRDQ